MLRNLVIVSQRIDFVKLAQNKIVICCVFGSLIFNLIFGLYYADKYMYIYFLNVGQGDATLIKTADNKYMLIDAGPDETILAELGKYMPFWKKKLDYVLLTHPDADHSGGMVSVIKSYKIDNFIYTGYPAETTIFKELLKISSENNISFGKFEPTEDFYIGCCTLINLVWPYGLNNLSIIEETNNAAQSFVLKFGHFRAFFGGDLDSNYEDKVAKYTPENLDLLKVSHHGSKYSTSEYFLKSFDPEFAVIEAGKGNSYGHPHKETLERLKKYEVTVLINYEYKKLFFKTDGKYLSYYTV